MSEAPRTRWQEHWDGNPDGWQGYADRFAKYHDDGTDVDGEARFLDMMLARKSRVLDAGAGSGRVGAALTKRGHRTLGVDLDDGLVAIGHERYPGLPLQVADLAQPLTSVADAAGFGTFEAIVCAGNVMVFTAPGTSGAILANFDAVLEPGGRAVFGFATHRDYTVADLDADAAAVGWTLEHRFGTWHLDPFTDESDWAVSVFRKPGVARQPDGPDGRWVPKPGQ